MENHSESQLPPTATVMTPPPVLELVHPRVEKSEAVASDSPPEKNEAENGTEEEKKQMKKNGSEEEKDIIKEDKEAAALVCGGGALLTYNEGELPGSPSFRVYFVGSAREAIDDDSLDPSTSSLDGREQQGRRNSMDSSNSEEREAKTSTKSKGRRFRALARRHSVVHGFLNVRSCYNHRQSDASDCRENSGS
ncbi:unnamed protein product [Spirodela intermedia]|uniref:Uncharacterized protein n=1 Tax=Spirodela intermedia TaxID=51605 RepID=A0A7I8ISS5_SPIIN|nr:unnamed protein product [Spirodela intermedia]CAA6660003.1 unnamed protein product [Spirodela intermedia]